jgi:hypothetical protein
MKKSPSTDSSFRKHATSIRMSKVARSIQTASAKTNWTEMTKLLFWADWDQSRHDEVVRLHLYGRRKRPEEEANPSYNVDQLQYILILMLVLTTAEKRTQEMYRLEFAQQCDQISVTHGLSEDQYWKDDKTPEEWRQLDVEFEKRSLQILLETLREYSMDEIAEHVQVAGARQFLEIIGNIEAQFVKVITHPIAGMLNRSMGERGSIPETLQTLNSTNEE